MRERAVFTTAMSSISIIVAAQTTTRVQRWVRAMCGGLRGREGEGRGRAHSPACGAPGLRSEPVDAGTGTGFRRCGCL